MSVQWCPNFINLLIFHEIVYVAIMGPVLAAAFLEWFLFLAAFNYCLVKAFQKAEHWSVKLLAVVMIICFTTLRYDNLVHDLTSLIQGKGDFSTRDGSDPTSTFSGNAVFSAKYSLIPLLVRLLYVCCALNDSFAVLYIPANNPQCWA